MTAPELRDVAERVLDIINELRPAFAVALVRQTSDRHDLHVTPDEVDRVSRTLPTGLAGHSIAELEFVVAQRIAHDRPDPVYRETVEAAGDPAPSSLGSIRSASTGGDPCSAIAGTTLDLPAPTEPAALISTDHVAAAGVLAVIYQYGNRLGFFPAVERAIQQLDGDELCISGQHEDLAMRLYCYGERDDRVKAPERARLAARALGLRDPDLPAGVEPDPVIQGLLDKLLDAIGDYCDPGPCRTDPTATDAFRLESAAAAVQVRLSASVTGLSVLKIRDLQRQFGTAQQILRDLAPFVRPLCRPGTPVYRNADEWVSVAALNGPRLPDGTDLFEAARTAQAWRTIFDWLIRSASSASLRTRWTPDICEAAVVLRPKRRERREPAGIARAPLD
jgi:hypothetical protein